MLSFLVLCAISSINYIINDIIDIEVDKLHPEKLNKRPLASGELSISFAWVITALLSVFILIILKNKEKPNVINGNNNNNIFDHS